MYVYVTIYLATFVLWDMYPCFKYPILVLRLTINELLTYFHLYHYNKLRVKKKVEIKVSLKLKDRLNINECLKKSKMSNLTTKFTISDIKTS